MDLHNVVKLIKTLSAENETNSSEEKAFNLEWIRLLKISMQNAITKKYLTTNRPRA